MSKKPSEDYAIENAYKNKQIITQKKTTNANVQVRWGTYKMEMPSTSERIDAIMTIDADDEVSLNYYHILSEVKHLNILNVLAMIPFDKDGKKYFHIAMEQFDCTLVDVINKHLKGFFEIYDETYVLRGQMLQNIIRELIEGLSALHDHGYYHGNISLQNTYVVYNDSGEVTVKLAKFHFIRSNPRLLIKNKIKDWHMLGMLLEELIGMKATECIKRSAVDREIKHLAWLLKNAHDIDTIKSIALSHTFFWRKDDYMNYFAAAIPVLLKDNSFTRKLNNTICRIPWNADGYEGLLAKMRGSYNGNSVIDFLRFISAAYNHFEENLDASIQGKIGHKLADLHEYITARHPELCFRLKLIERSMPDAQR